MAVNTNTTTTGTVVGFVGKGALHCKRQWKMPAGVLLLFHATWQGGQAWNGEEVGGQIFATLREQRASNEHELSRWLLYPERRRGLLNSRGSSAILPLSKGGISDDNTWGWLILFQPRVETMVHHWWVYHQSKWKDYWWQIAWHRLKHNGGPSGQIVGLGWLRSAMFQSCPHAPPNLQQP